MATIQTEKYTLGIVESDGTPKTGALVELKIGASTYVLLELGTGKYQIASIPTGKYFVWIDSVNSGESVSVGSGQVPALGNEADAFLIGEASDWKLGTTAEVKTLLSLENVANIAIPDPTGNNGKVLSVSGDAYQLANFLDVSDKLDKIDPTAQSVVSEVTFDGAVTTNNFLTTNAPIIANAPIQHKAIDSYYDSNGVLQGYIYASPTDGMVIQADASQIDEIHLIDDTFVSEKLTTASLEVSGGSDLQGPATLGASVTLNGITSATPAKTLGRNASNQIVEFDNVVAGGQVDSVVGGTNVTIDNTDPINPIINATDTDLQTAYNNSTTPEITTDATRGALTLKRGSALDSDNILEGKNGAGDTTSNITGVGGATFEDSLNVATSSSSFPIRLESSGNCYIKSTTDSDIGWNGKQQNGDNRFFVESKTGVANTFNLKLFSIDGLTSQAVFKSTYDANFEIYRNLEATERILQGSVTDDTSTGIQAESLRVEGDVILEGIVDATPTKALGINASDEVVSYAVNVPRVTSVTSTTTLTVDSSTTDQAVITAQSGALTIASPTGSSANGQKLVIRIKAVGTSVITWNAIFRIIGTTLPVSTTANKTIYVGVVYNSLDTKWDVVAVAEEA